jgi:hypothetical protein
MPARTWHPAAVLDRSARIGVIGAGPAGLTAAARLVELGFGNVTVLEAAAEVGGKCRSLDVAGTARGAVEAGTVFFLPSPVWSKHLRRLGIPEETVALPRVRILDVARAETFDPLTFPSPHPTADKLAASVRFLRMVKRARAGFGAALGPEIDDALTLPTRTWFEREGLGFVQDVLMPVAAGAQLGPLMDEGPALYALRLLSMLDRVSAFEQLTLCMPQLRTPHQRVWQGVARTLDLRLGHRVTSIERGPPLRVRTERGEHVFDRVLFMAWPQELAGLLDGDTAPLDRVRHLRRAVVVLRAEGLPSGVFFAPRYPVQPDGRRTAPEGWPVLLFQVDARSGLYAFYPFLGEQPISDDELERRCRAVIEPLGARRIERPLPVVRWPWFPHFGADDLRAGAYRMLAARQGEGGLWIGGELVAGVGVPHVIEHAEALAQAVAA